VGEVDGVGSVNGQRAHAITVHVVPELQARL
jgi:hypothetical protein